MRPWLILPPKLAHDLAPLALDLLATFRSWPPPEWQPFQWRGLHFPNRLGIAGGIDKNGDSIESWWKFGAGFIEVGTVTPKPQGPNPGKIIDRDLASSSVWNKMGFPGAGVDHVRANLIDLPSQRPTPIFVNVGKNRSTPNELAARDYAFCIKNLNGLADAFVVNISSPNTAGLRDLLHPSRLGDFLREVLEARDASAAPSNAANPATPPTPILLKLSPDLDDESLSAVVEVACSLKTKQSNGIDGFIATNTTSRRQPGSPFPAEGGVSGLPLAEASKNCLRQLLVHLGPSRQNKLIVSTGGIMSAADVQERLTMGADLVQVYTALIYLGPTFFEHVAQEMRL